MFLLPLLLVSAAKQKEPPMIEIPDDAPVGKGELDAMAQVAGSSKMEGMKFGKREVSADGKSGRIMLEPKDGAKQESWSPKFNVPLHELRKRAESEDVVLAYFWSSEDDYMRMSYDAGKEIEVAAQELLEGEREASVLMVNMANEKDAAAKQLLREYGVINPCIFKVFINGRPHNYRGATTSKGLVAYMNERAGPPTTKLETSEALDALLGSATATVVVGVFGPAYQGASSREVFAENAREMRETGRLSFVEVSTRVANGAKTFANEATPFDTATSVFAVVRSPKWLGKGETPYYTHTEFRKMRSFINAHAWTTISVFSEALIEHAKRVRQGAGPMYVVSLLLDTKAHASKLRYVVKQYHKLVEALEPSVAEKFTFAVTHRDARRIDPWLSERFERTTVKGEFFSGDNFAEKYARDFTLIVSDPRRAYNWADNEEGGVSPDRVQLTSYAPFLARVASGQEPPLAQGDSAAAAAGLKEMKMGFGPDGGGMTEVTGEKKKKKKKKAKAESGKSEL